MSQSSCIFCQIVSGIARHFPVWESATHLAFLSIFPNTPGFSVVIPKEHLPSALFANTEEVQSQLVKACRETDRRLRRAFPDIDRCALVFEGFGIDHLHGKLIPLHGTRQEAWRPILSQHVAYTEHYEGYVTTHDGPRADDTSLTALAERIRSA